MSTDLEDAQGIEDAQETTHYVPQGVPPRNGGNLSHLYQPLTSVPASSSMNFSADNVPSQPVTGRLFWTFVVGGIMGAAAAGCFLVSSARNHGNVSSRVDTAINACEGKDCVNFDCKEDEDDWLKKWSDSKKLYCCGMTCLETAIKFKEGKLKGDAPALPVPTVPKHNEHPGTTSTTSTTTSTTISTSSKATTEQSTSAKTPMTKGKPMDTRPPVVLKGISYCPVPVKAPKSLKSDDWMTDMAKPLWSSAGRGDLHIIHTLGGPMKWSDRFLLISFCRIV